MKLYVVGAGNAFVLKGQFHTCYVIENPATEKMLMLDCGFSAPVNFNRMNLNPQNLDGIFISHLHGDHFGGLSTLLLDMMFMRRLRDTFTIIGPRGLEETVSTFFEYSYPKTLRHCPYKIEFIELAAGESCDFHGIKFETVKADHIDPLDDAALMVKVRWGGKTLTFSGDTRWQETIPSFFQDCDLGLLECSLTKKNPAIEHISYEEILLYQKSLAGLPLYLVHLADELLGRTDMIFPEARDSMVLSY